MSILNVSIYQQKQQVNIHVMYIYKKYFKKDRLIENKKEHVLYSNITSVILFYFFLQKGLKALELGKMIWYFCEDRRSGLFKKMNMYINRFCLSTTNNHIQIVK